MYETIGKWLIEAITCIRKESEKTSFWAKIFVSKKVLKIVTVTSIFGSAVSKYP